MNESREAASEVRLLAIGAHPDDVEFGCGGILAVETARGHAVTIMSLSRGESGTSGSPAERQHESEAAAKALGASIEFLPLEGDGRLEYRPPNALAIAAAIRRLRPCIVLAPSPDEDQHPDHAKAARLTRDAARLARYGGLAGMGPEPAHSIEALYFYDVTGVGQAQALAHLAKIVIDVTPVLATWKRAMDCHVSQQATRRYADLMLARARALGAGIGVEHAMAVWANDPIRLDALTDLRSTTRLF